MEVSLEPGRGRPHLEIDALIRGVSIGFQQTWLLLTKHLPQLFIFYVTVDDFVPAVPFLWLKELHPEHRLGSQILLQVPTRSCSL